MSDIQIYKQDNLPSMVRSIGDALNSHMLNIATDEELFYILKCEIAISMAKTGKTVTIDDTPEISVMIHEIIKELRFDKMNLRLDEIQIAFNNGVQKKYGDYYGLNVVSFCFFIREYIKDGNRIEALRIKNLPKEENKEPTIEERFQLAGYNALKALTDYSSGKDISLVAPTVYKFLVRLKIIQYSDEEKEQFIAEAEKDVRNELSLRAKISTDKHERNKILAAIANGHDLETKIILQAQRLGLYAYFQTCIIEGIDLKQTILKHKP